MSLVPEDQRLVVHRVGFGDGAERPTIFGEIGHREDVYFAFREEEVHELGTCESAAEA